jgi:thioredoxin 1
MFHSFRLAYSKAPHRMFSNLVLPGSQDAFNAIIKSDGKTILYYTASWCPPCKAIAPIFEKLSKENKDITFAKIDVDTLPEAADFAKIRSVPTFLFRNKQANIAEFSGADEGKLKANIQKLNQL